MQQRGEAELLGIMACTIYSIEVKLNILVLLSVLPDPTASLRKLYITRESRDWTESNDTSNDVLCEDAD